MWRIWKLRDVKQLAQGGISSTWKRDRFEPEAWSEPLCQTGTVVRVQNVWKTTSQTGIEFVAGLQATGTPRASVSKALVEEG